MSKTVIGNLSSAEDVAQKAAGDLQRELVRLLESQQSVNLVLTGGTVGIMVLGELAPLIDHMDLSGLHIWWGDERFVESNSQDRNSVQAHEALLSRIRIPLENIHEMPAIDVGDLETASNGFSELFEPVPPVFDIALLGMGPDGHVASLFPGSKAIEFGEWIIAEPDSPKPPRQRISLSYAALKSARQVWFLVAGKDKASAVSRVFAGEDLPATRVSGKELTKWYLDEAAASEITS